MNFSLKIFLLVIILALNNSLCAQVNVVLVEPTVKKFIGDVSKLDRSKYFNIQKQQPHFREVVGCL